MQQGNKPPNIQARTFTFAIRVVKLCQHLDEQPGVARVLARQILRAGTSIGANMEEAQAGESKADFTHKCAIALKEARETHYWLRLLASSDIVQPSLLADMLKEAEVIQRIIGAIIVTSNKESAR